MSEVKNSTEDKILVCCASCGATDKKLMSCSACQSVKYCCKQCQLAHRREHRRECKRIEKKRQQQEAFSTFLSKILCDNDAEEHAEEDDDPDLFKPPPPREECPVCFVPFTLDPSESNYNACCGKMVCNACTYESVRVVREENLKRKMADMMLSNGDAPRRPQLEESCAFCRSVLPMTDEEIIERLRKRMKVDDAAAFYNMGGDYRHGRSGLPKDSRKAFEHLKRGAELGSGYACCLMATIYTKSQGVAKDISKARYYLKMGAKRGHVESRHNLGALEYEDGKTKLAMRHFRISAAAGHNLSLDALKTGLLEGTVTGKEYDDIALANKNALDLMSSDKREKWRCNNHAQS